MIQHMVMFKFAETTTRAQQDGVMQHVQDLRDIPGVMEVHCNHDISDRSKGYSLGMVVRMKDRETLQSYGPHPVHQALVGRLKEIGLVDLIVLDFEV